MNGVKLAGRRCQRHSQSAAFTAGALVGAAAVAIAAAAGQQSTAITGEDSARIFFIVHFSLFFIIWVLYAMVFPQPAECAFGIDRRHHRDRILIECDPGIVNAISISLFRAAGSKPEQRAGDF